MTSNSKAKRSSVVKKEEFSGDLGFFDLMSAD